MIKKFTIGTLREIIGLENDYESLLSNQDQILDQSKQLEKIEIQHQELILEEKKESYYDYLTIKNALWVLFFLGFMGFGFWLYNADFFNNSTLESIDYKGVLDALKKFNENSANLSKEEIKLLLEVKRFLLKKGKDENQSPILQALKHL